jgi:hypothetical protein
VRDLGVEVFERAPTFDGQTLARASLVRGDQFVKVQELACDTRRAWKARSARGLEPVGGRARQKAVVNAASKLMKAFMLDYVVIGGVNAKKSDPHRLPHELRIGHNLTAWNAIRLPYAPSGNARKLSSIFSCGESVHSVFGDRAIRNLSLRARHT